MDISSQLNIKPLYRISGTPENFLTALRHFTWGFKPDLEQKWRNLYQGDLLFFHSTVEHSKFLRNPPSCLIGFGIVGNNFYFDRTPLWIDEKLDGLSYPWRFSFSEIYLFSNIPVNDEWDSATLDKRETTEAVLSLL